MIMVAKKEILINRMFTGGYISTGRNLAHETINLFKDDNGRNFIYVQAYGAVGKSHCKKDRKGNIITDTIETILLVKPSGKNTWEVVAKAEGLHPMTFFKTSWKKERAEINNYQRNYIDKESITYDNIPLYELFESNENDENAIYYTYEADRVVKAKNPIYITTSNYCENDDAISLDNVKNFAKSSLKMYIEKGQSKNLDKIISNENNWGEETKRFIEFKNKINIKEKTNFLKIIDKEDDELIFSNLFKYVFDENPNVTSKFFEKFCNIKLNQNKIEIKREYEDIDILVYDDNNVIVIENKIKSGINGLKNGKTQLDKYYEIITSQKDKNNEDNQHYGKTNFFLVFLPNHNNLNIKKYSSKYKLIKYSDIYDFFKEYHYEYNNDIYFSHFFSALEKHIKATDNSLEEDMYRMFAKHVEMAKIKLK